MYTGSGIIPERYMEYFTHLFGGINCFSDQQILISQLFTRLVRCFIICSVKYYILTIEKFIMIRSAMSKCFGVVPF